MFILVIGLMKYVLPLLEMKGILRKNTQNQIKALTALFGDSEFLPNNLLTRVLADLVCDAKLSSPLCTNLIFQVSGPDSKQFNEVSHSSLQSLLPFDNLILKTHFK